jgi:uncharacterized protein (DUF2141 family)
MSKKRIVLNKVGFLGIAFFMSIILVQCGQRGTPSGGPKDTTPPQINKSTPENYSTNFTGTKISIKFDEYVQIKSFKENFLISPPVNTVPKYRLTGKTLVLDFDTTFNENTTYSMFFGEAIVDLNEGNPLDSNLFVFSTGDILDSLTIKGTITDALSGQDESDLLVHLYRNQADSAPLTVLPAYFAVVKKGAFKFTNLAAGEYKIFALKDGNRNYLYDLPDEKIAFSNDLVIVPSDSTSIDLHTFQPEPNELKIFKPNSKNEGEILVSFNKAVESNYTYSFLDSIIPTGSIIEQWNTARDSLILYSTMFKSANKYLMKLSVDTLVRDSIAVKIGKKPMKFKASTNYTRSFANNFNNPLKFTFNKPLATFCDSCIFLIIDSAQHQITGNSFDVATNTVTVNYNFKENSDYNIILDSAAFTSLLGESSDSLKFDFPTNQAKDLGNLLLIYDFPWGDHYLLDIMQNESLIQQLIISDKKGNIDILGLKPGEYHLKLSIDENADQRWSPGSYLEKRQSEEVKLYTNEITIRPNWDVEVEWVAE